MRTVRFAADGAVREGTVDPDGTYVEASGRRFDPAGVVHLPPVRIRNLFGVALNYRDHAAELSLSEPEVPALFLKPLSAALGSGAGVVMPDGARSMHYEAEIAAVIGRPVSRATPAEALAAVSGYTIANDVTVRDFITNVFRPPTKAKGFDTFLPIGPCLVSPDEVGDVQTLGIRTYVNGDLRQEGTSRDMVWPVGELLAYICAFTTLMPGDVILTGTPRGISPIVPGDRVRIDVDRLGSLSNDVVAERDVYGRAGLHACVRHVPTRGEGR